MKVKSPSYVRLFMLLLTGKIIHLSKAWRDVSLCCRLYASSFSKQSHFHFNFVVKETLVYC